jgi:glycosyltransferase involved in cell wall biosynthesis
LQRQGPGILNSKNNSSAVANKKISIVAPDLAAGGMTRAYALAQALAHAGYGVEILGVMLTKGSLYPFPPANIKVTQVSGPSTLFALLRLLARLDGDIIYAIKPRPSSYGVALLKRLINGRPVMLDIDDWELAEVSAAREQKKSVSATQAQRPRGIVTQVKKTGRHLRHLRRWLNVTDQRYIKWLDRAICKADAITVNTRFVQNLYGGIYVPQCKDTVKYDPDRYDPDDSRRHYGLADYIVLMFPGTPRPHKGLEDMLAAMGILQNPRIRLVLVGGRSSGERYIDELMKRWRQWIVRLPAFPAEEMPRVVAAAHAVVVAQRDTAIARAQFPMKLTDAMAMGKPVITTTVGDIPEIIGNTGYLVQPSSPEQLAAAVDSIVKDPQAALNRGRQARDRFVRGYSLEAVGPMLSDIIEKLS